MAGFVQTKSRVDRLIILLSAVWFVASLILSLFIMEEEGLETHEFLLLLMVFLSPIFIYWAVRWVRDGDKTKRDEEKEDKYAEVVRKEPALITTSVSFGLGRKLQLLMLFAAFMLAGFAADFFINLHMTDTAIQHGWGNIPPSLISDVERWTNYSMIVRATSGIGFLIVVAMAYTDAKVQLEGSGVRGIKCSVGMLFVWFIIPFANIVMPWRAFGALDRAANFAAKYGRGGELWNQKGHRGVSYRAILLGVLFVLVGTSATIYNKQLASISTRTPHDIWDFASLIHQSNELLVLMGAIYALFIGAVWMYFFFINKNLQSITRN